MHFKLVSIEIRFPRCSHYIFAHSAILIGRYPHRMHNGDYEIFATIEWEYVKKCNNKKQNWNFNTWESTCSARVIEFHVRVSVKLCNRIWKYIFWSCVLRSLVSHFAHSLDDVWGNSRVQLEAVNHLMYFFYLRLSLTATATQYLCFMMYIFVDVLHAEQMKNVRKKSQANEQKSLKLKQTNDARAVEFVRSWAHIAVVFISKSNLLFYLSNNIFKVILWNWELTTLVYVVFKLPHSFDMLWAHADAKRANYFRHRIIIIFWKNIFGRNCNSLRMTHIWYQFQSFAIWFAQMRYELWHKCWKNDADIGQLACVISARTSFDFSVLFLTYSFMIQYAQWQ